ncbi:MoxR family ATPase [Kangiella sp. HZ709]|uniref:AAA family ATPase n=1 Tax=Kangiella sp. HZ709 TaxID=2666328 RepID=UPI0012B03C25|nr:MoxR family ATPase [Kangiella sp. HZ709]MRX28503.1 AAA domain-containing protein [Kangiella sp. HZ709]
MHQALTPVLNQLNKVVLGKSHQVKLSVACLLAEGHLLIEDLPGMGKTTLGQAIAKVFGLEFQRIQFTSDILPADIIGANIFDKNDGQFKFHPGPVFSQLILGDEINRATPKAQSALLEAMEEQQVTVEGETFALPQPFFVIATQNPSHQIGTYPLPESQLDRFLFRIQLGYPDASFERVLLQGKSGRQNLNTLEPMLSLEDLMRIQQEVAKVTVSEHLLNYVIHLIKATRQSPDFEHGLSPRGGLALIGAAKAWAFLDGRDYVLPEDIQQTFIPAVAHRLEFSQKTSGDSVKLVSELLEQVSVPS